MYPFNFRIRKAFVSNAYCAVQQSFPSRMPSEDCKVVITSAKCHHVTLRSVKKSSDYCGYHWSPVCTSCLDGPSRWTVKTDHHDGRTFLTTVSTDRRDGCSVCTSRLDGPPCLKALHDNALFRRSVRTVVLYALAVSTDRRDGPSRRSSKSTCVVAVHLDGPSVRRDSPSRWLAYWAWMKQLPMQLKSLLIQANITKKTVDPWAPSLYFTVLD